MQGSGFIGRIGGLAAALGVGVAVVFVGAGTAHAVPDNSSRTPAEADSDIANSAGVPQGRTGAVRRPSPAGAASAGAARKSGASAGVGSRVAVRSARGVPARSVVKGPDPVIRGRDVPGQISAPPVSAGPPVAPAAALASPSSTATSAPTDGLESPQQPVMTVSTQGTAAAADSLPTPWSATGSDLLADSPLGWMVLSAVRRQPGQQTTSPAAAAVTSGQILTVQTALARLRLWRSNKAPVISGATLGNPDTSTGAVTGTVNASDPEGGTLTYKATTSSKGSVTISSAGVFTYTPTTAARHAAAKLGAGTSATTDTVMVTVTDPKGASTGKSVTINILGQNSVPVAGTTTVGTPNPTTGVVTGTVTATDADQDSLAYSAPGTTSKGAVSIDSGTGAFTYTPAAGSRTSVTGSDTFTVTVTDGYGGSTQVPVSVPVAPQSATPASISFVFNYGAGARFWSTEAKDALQASADAVAAYFVVSAPVTLVFDVTAMKAPWSSTLASTGSDLVSTGAGFFNTVVQNKVLNGIDSNGAAADGSIDVNFGIPWAYGSSVSGSQYDFESTLMHEMLHAYGFLAYVDQPGWNSGTNWTKFDSFIVNKSGAKVINPSTYRFNAAYTTNLTGGAGGLYFGGSNAVAVYGGPVPLYTPSPWEAGSSVSHLDDNTFRGTNAQLMNAMADTGLGIRTLSPVELGILKDIGYTVTASPAAGTLLFVGFFFLRRRRPATLSVKHPGAERD